MDEVMDGFGRNTYCSVWANRSVMMGVKRQDTGYGMMVKQTCSNALWRDDACARQEAASHLLD
jgi:hypothetical protein